VRTRRPGWPLAAVLLAAACASGCEKTARNMYDQPRDKPLASSTLWRDTRSAREPVGGSLPRSAGIGADTSSGRRGDVTPEPPIAPPLPLVVTSAPAKAAGDASRDATPDAALRRAWTPQLMARGRERYDIFCSPCHSIAGDGDGMIARRGFPHPPTFHSDRLRQAPDAHFYAVITDGYGAMYPYANRVPPDDRRAIIAYIRALQLSQHAALADAPADARARLGSAK
jgi:cytochrome c5